jgi:hypothetical protein
VSVRVYREHRLEVLDDRGTGWKPPGAGSKRTSAAWRRGWARWPSGATGGSGSAGRINFLNRDQLLLEDATYSTCKPEDPDWYLKADKLLISIVGKAADIAKPLERLGFPISYVDFEGKPTSAPKLDAVPAGLTANAVVTASLKAMGGLDRINALKSVNWTQEASIMGITIKTEVAFTAPNTLIQKQTSPMGSSETRYEGENVTVTAKNKIFTVL